MRLTQGGEPTFVSVDDRDGAEWNTEAMGPTKRLLSADLMDKLRAKYGDGGLLHYGQGKWYPGEQLPRWSLNLFWRKDGEPVWTHPELFADEHKDYGVTEEQARQFLHGVARRLALDPKYVFPAYEDVWYYLWRERKLPVNVDPFDARLADPLERERLRKVFTQGLDKVVGHVLPVARTPGAGAHALADRPVVPAQRALLPDPGRFGDGLPPAAGFAALGLGAATCPGCTRPTRTSRSRRCRRTGGCAIPNLLAGRGGQAGGEADRRQAPRLRRPIACRAARRSATPLRPRHRRRCARRSASSPPAGSRAPR